MTNKKLLAVVTPPSVYNTECHQVSLLKLFTCQSYDNNCCGYHNLLCGIFLQLDLLKYGTECSSVYKNCCIIFEWKAKLILYINSSLNHAKINVTINTSNNIFFKVRCNTFDNFSSLNYSVCGAFLSLHFSLFILKIYPKNH